MCNLIDTNVERGQAECTAMTTRTTATTPTPSDPQRTTFVIHLDYVLGAWSRCLVDLVFFVNHEVNNLFLYNKICFNIS